MSSPFLSRIGLQRPELRAWAFYDWANSAYFTVVVTSVFPIYFNGVALAGAEKQVATDRLLLGSALASLIVAISAPLLGAAADLLAARRRLLALNTGVGVLASLAMAFVGEGDWLPALSLLVVGNVAVGGALVCYDAYLPSLADDGEADRLSTAGYALGYLGGGLLLAAVAAWQLWGPELEGWPHASAKLAFIGVAVWWAVFSLPLLTRVPEPPATRATPAERERLLRTAYARVFSTFSELRRYRHAALLLLSVLLYGEGIQTIMRSAASYAKDREIADDTLILAILLTQFVGVPFALLFGQLASRIGARRALYVALAIYCGICVYGFWLETGAEFIALAIGVGLVQGGAQALGRSLYASMVPMHRAAEFFGFFALGGKVAGIFGPLLAFLVGTAAGDNRYGFLSIVAFFVAGAYVLSRVDLEAGARAAREADEAHAASG